LNVDFLVGRVEPKPLGEPTGKRVVVVSQSHKVKSNC
jgi:hypothetical protein